MAGYNDVLLTRDYVDVNTKDTDYYVNEVILTLQDIPEYEYFRVEFWEEDTGSRAPYSVLDNFTSRWDGQPYAIKGHFRNVWASGDDHIGSRTINLDYSNLSQFIFDDVTLRLGKTY